MCVIAQLCFLVVAASVVSCQWSYGTHLFSFIQCKGSTSVQAWKQPCLLEGTWSCFTDHPLLSHTCVIVQLYFLTVAEVLSHASEALPHARSIVSCHLFSFIRAFNSRRHTPLKTTNKRWCIKYMKTYHARSPLFSFQSSFNLFFWIRDEWRTLKKHKAFRCKSIEAHLVQCVVVKILGKTYPTRDIHKGGFQKVKIESSKPILLKISCKYNSCRKGVGLNLYCYHLDVCLSHGFPHCQSYIN